MTTSLIDRVCKKNQIRCINDLLVGFKYIGQEMNTLEKQGAIDGFIMGTCSQFISFGKRVASLQNANVRFYATFMLVGMSCVFVYLYISLGL